MECAELAALPIRQATDGKAQAPSASERVRRFWSPLESSSVLPNSDVWGAGSLDFMPLRRPERLGHVASTMLEALATDNKEARFGAANNEALAADDEVVKAVDEEEPTSPCSRPPETSAQRGFIKSG